MTQTRETATAQAMASALAKCIRPEGLTMSLEESPDGALLVFEGLRGSGKPGRAPHYLTTYAFGGPWFVLDSSGNDMQARDADARAARCGAAAAADQFRRNYRAEREKLLAAPCVGMPTPAREARLARLAAHSPIENTPYHDLPPEARAMVDSADPMVRREAAAMGFALETLADDASPWVRREVRDQGFALDSGYSFANPDGCMSRDWLEANGMDIHAWRERYPERRAIDDAAFAKAELDQLDSVLDEATQEAREVAGRVNAALPASTLAEIAAALMEAAERAEQVEASQAERRAQLSRTASPTASPRVQRARASVM